MSRAEQMKSIREETQGVMDAYLWRFQDERVNFAEFNKQFAVGDELFSRACVAGHVTASAAVLDETKSKTLLIHHRFLDRWIPPGGHYEGSGSLWECAKTEVWEETGVSVQILAWGGGSAGIPIDINTHQVPENKDRGEASHWHHDFRFLAQARQGHVIRANERETKGAKWASFHEMLEIGDARVKTLAKKLMTLKKEGWI